MFTLLLYKISTIILIVTGMFICCLHAMSLYPQTRKTISTPFRRLMVFCLLGVLPSPGNTENFCGYAPIAALKNMTEAAVSYSLCCI